MPTCKRCGGEFDVEQLVRHESGSYVVVHCPNCHSQMGSWRDPAKRRQPSSE